MRGEPCVHMYVMAYVHVHVHMYMHGSAGRRRREAVAWDGSVLPWPLPPARPRAHLMLHSTPHQRTLKLEFCPRVPSTVEFLVYGVESLARS